MGYALKLIGSGKYNGKKRPTILHFGEDVYCPLCLKTIIRKHVHHHVQRSDGGPDQKRNLLVICVPCHDLVHHDEGMDGHFSRYRLYQFMTAIYGVLSEFNHQNGSLQHLRDAWLLHKHGLAELSFLKVVRIYNKVIKEQALFNYRKSFDEDTKYIGMGDWIEGYLL